MTERISNDVVSAAFQPITVNITNRVMNVLSTRLWYLPAWSVLRYNSQNADGSITPQQPGFELTNLSPEGSQRNFFIGGAGPDEASGNFYNVFLGGAGNDNLGRRGDPVAGNLSLLWGGTGSDLFHVYWNSGGVIINDVLDLTAEDRLHVHFASDKPMSSAAFQADVRLLQSLFPETKNYIFDVVAAGSTFTGSAFDDLIRVGGTSNFARSISGGNGNDTLIGSSRAETFNGGAGNDVIDGGGGGDQIIGSAGADIIYFYKGDEIVAFNPTDLADDSVIIKTVDTTVSGAYARVLYDLSSDATGKTLNGGRFNDTLTGAGARQILNGGDGQDLLTGLADQMTLNGGAGNDTLIGIGRNITLVGGAGIDIFRLYNETVVIRDVQRGETIIASDSSASFVASLSKYVSAGAQIVFNVNRGLSQTALSITGFQGNDRFIGSWSNDFIQGAGGNDFISGGLGQDTLVGGDGNDSLYGDDNVDLLNGGNGNDWLEGGNGNDSLSGDGGNDTLIGGYGSDALNGGLGNDVLIGLDGNDTISGGDGNDTLNGGTGENLLTGGAGADIFVFGPTNQGLVSTVTDFVSGQDKIDLSGFSLAGFSIAAIRNAVQYNAATRIVSADINKDGTLDAHVRLSSGSFNRSNDLVISTLLA